MDRQLETATRVLDAVKRDDVQTLEALILEVGVDVSVPVKMSYPKANIEIFDTTTPLVAAVVSKSLKSLELLLERGANKEATFGGATPLMIACVAGGQRFVEALLGAGANPSAADGYGWSALHLCRFDIQIEALRATVAAGADINGTTSVGLTPMMAAVIYGDNGTIKAMVDLGADVGMKIRDIPFTSSYAGRFVGQFNGNAIMDTLMTSRDARGRRMPLGGYSALALAAALGCDEKIQVLLANGADPNEPVGAEGIMPLHAAIACGHIEAAKTLLIGGSNPEKWVQDRGRAREGLRDCPSCQKQITASARRCPHCGADMADQDSLQRLAVDNHPLKVVIDAEGTSLLMHAVATGDQELLDACLRSKPPLDERNAKGATALMMAADVASAIAAQALLRAGANADAVDDKGYTALMHAISAGAPDVALVLVDESDCSLVHADQKGWGALHLAVAEGDTQVLRRLLQNGALTSEVKVSGDASAHTVTFAQGDQVLEVTAPCAWDEMRGLLLEHAHRHKNPEWFRTSASINKELDRLTAEYGLDSALSLCAWYEQTHLVRAALDRGADPNWRDPKAHGRTPLFSSAMSLDMDVGAILLAAGADARAIESDTGATPLHYYAAVIRTHNDLLNPLLAAGADVNAVDCDGFRPIDYAERSGNGALQRILLEAGSEPACYRDRLLKEENAKAAKAAFSLVGQAALAYFAAKTVRDWWQKEDE